MATLKVFEQSYCGESIHDCDRDMAEAFDERFNPLVKDIPQDENGFHAGTFKVTIEWLPE